MAKRYVTERVRLDFDSLSGDLDKVIKYLQSSVPEDWRERGFTPLLEIDAECDPYGGQVYLAFLIIQRPETSEEAAARKKEAKARASMIKEDELAHAREILAKYGEL